MGDPVVSAEIPVRGRKESNLGAGAMLMVGAASTSQGFWAATGAGGGKNGLPQAAGRPLTTPGSAAFLVAIASFL